MIQEGDHYLPLVWSQHLYGNLVHTLAITRLSAPSRLGMHFEFDRVFGSNATTADVFQYAAKPIVEGAMNGVNGTVFAYGQTSSGKTYTMTGTSAYPGLTPMTVDAVFAHIAATDHREFVLKISYIEVYNETLNDLLNPGATDIKLQEDPQRGVVVTGVREETIVNTDDEIVFSAQQVLARIAAGEAVRHVGRHNMSEASSRSHSIFKMVIESRPVKDTLSGEANEKPAGVLVSNLYMVDLAGSERIAKTGASGMSPLSLYVGLCW